MKKSFIELKPEYLKVLKGIINEVEPCYIWTLNQLVQEINKGFVRPKITNKLFHRILINNRDWHIFKCKNERDLIIKYIFIRKQK